jgi:hypothetical protein
MKTAPAFLLSILVSITLATAAPLPARAQGPADVAAARDLFIEASRFAGEGKWEEARDRFERSLALKRAAITLYSLGIAQKNTGRFVAALENLRAFLAEPLVPATKQYEKPARDAIAELEKRVGRIKLDLKPAGLGGVVVEIDGEAVPEAALDRPRLVDPGQHQAVVRARGYKEARGTVNVTEGSTAVIPLELQPMRTVFVRGERAPEAASMAGGERAERPSRALPVALLVGGTLVFAGGLAVGLVGIKEASDAPTRDGPDADSARTKMVIGDIVGGVGVVVATIGVIVLATSGGRGSARIGARGAAFRF